MKSLTTRSPMLRLLALLLLSATLHPVVPAVPPECAPTQGPEEERAADAAAIRALLERCYVEGVYRQRDPDLVREGFAPTFVMQVFWDGKLASRPLERWLEKMQLDRVPSDRPVRAEIQVLEITGVAALARLDSYLEERHTFTDYFGLYETENGWKVVSKLFHAYR